MAVAAPRSFHLKMYENHPFLLTNKMATNTLSINGPENPELKI
jgi:hypothetical protein